MGRFPEQFIQQVLQSTDIVELVGRYVSLKRKGKEFVGLCPFHNDNNPSLYVSPAKQIFKCFACGAGGNVLQFVMNYEKQSFPEAVRALAEWNSIPLPKEYLPPKQEKGMSKNDLLEVTEFAAAIYRRNLRSEGGAAALDYVHSRSVTDESIERFGLGFAPDTWDNVYSSALREGFSEQQLVATGLCRRSRDGDRCFDYFRNRLIFPIHDLNGRVVAFGGRTMSADEKTKYLNSPQGVLYDKSSLVYPIHLAREGIMQRRRVVVVEGYFDAIVPMQAGIDNVVATLGTSLTERHVRLLGRYADEAVIVFDADLAGAAAAERAMEMFLAQKIHIRIAAVPAGKDPCDLVVDGGADALRVAVEESPDALEYIWDRRYEQFTASGGKPSDRNRVIDDFLRLIVESRQYGAIDQVRQQNLAQHIAHMLNVPALDLQRRIGQIARRTNARAGRNGRALISAGAKSDIPHGPEREVLEVLLDRPDLFDMASERIDPEDFRDARLAVIARWIWKLGESGKLTLEDLMGREEMADSSPLLAELALAAQRRGNHELSLAEAVQLMANRREEKEFEDFKTECLHQDTLTELQERLRKAHEEGGHGRRRPKIQ